MTATASLTLTGSVAALAAALQAFDAASDRGAQPAYNPSGLDTSAAGNFLPDIQTASISTGAGTLAPTLTPSDQSGDVSTPTVPMPTTFTVSTTTPTAPTGEDEDEGGEASDGTGVDAEGLPWDERVHSSSKKKTAKGLWVAVRNGPKGAELVAIKDELRGVTQQTLPMPAVSEPVQPVAVPMPAVDTGTSVMMPAPVPMPVAVPMPAVSEPVQQVTMQPAPIPMPVASEPVAPVEAPAELVPLATAPVLEWDFAKLMGVLGPKIGAGTITTDYLVQVCQKYGLNAVTDTAQKPEVIPHLIGQFQADGVW